MKFNINNFINTSNQSSKIVDFQDLDHIDGVSISAVSAGLYKFKRDELVLFYFRDGANYASVYTQSKLISENLKWNKKIKAKTLIYKSNNLLSIPPSRRYMKILINAAINNQLSESYIQKLKRYPSVYYPILSEIYAVRIFFWVRKRSKKISLN